MKTEREIREYRDALKKLVHAPCSCSTPEHTFKCRRGGLGMRVAIMELSWILGEGEDHQPFVDAITEDAARRRLPR